MKRIFSFVLCIHIFNCVLFSQNIYNSSDVKLKTPLKQDWSYNTNEIIVNQRIVDNICFINTVEGVIAISLKDGKELWKYSYPAKPVIPSVVSFSNKYAVYVTYMFDEQSEKGTSSLVLIDLSNGKEKWNQTSEENWYRPTPFIDDKNVYCIAGPPGDWEENKDFYEMELDNAVLFAISIADGNITWQQGLNDEQTRLLRVDGNYLFTIHDFDISDSGKEKNVLSCISTTDGNELWEYNPSGMITKAFIGDVKIMDNVVYAFPLIGSINSISAIDLTSGEEIWQRDNVAADGFFFLNDQLLTYGNSSTWKFGTLTAWWAFDLNEGEKLFSKDIASSTDIGSMLGSAFGGTIFGTLYRFGAGIVNVVTLSFLDADNEMGPKLISTRTLFEDFGNSSTVNEKGIFATYLDDDISKFVIMKPIENDETRIEWENPTPDTYNILANGTSPTSAFITYNGKVASINILSGQQEWIKEFEPDATSLGLIIRGDKMYLFTTNSVQQLSSE